MAMSKSLAAYQDVQSVLNAALAHGTIVLDLPTPSAAKNFRMRMYYYRKLLHAKKLHDLATPYAFTTTPYDELRFEISAAEPTKITVSRLIFRGTITTPDGKPVPLEPASAPAPTPEPSLEDDPLLAEAEALRKKLDLE